MCRYSWRVPFIIGGGPAARIVASWEVPRLGTAVSQPVFLQWHWYNSIRNLPIWALIVFLLVVPRENRDRRAWLILIPIALPLGLLCLPAIAGLMDPSTAEMVGFLVGAGVLAWSVVWLTGHWLDGYSRRRSFWLLLVVMLAIGLLACICQFEAADDVLPLLIVYGLCVFDLLLALTLAGYFCRKNYSLKRFLGFSLLWVGAYRSDWQRPAAWYSSLPCRPWIAPGRRL